MNTTTALPWKASFYTLGCRLNQTESDLVANSFRQKGYEIVEFGQRTDICVINSCTVTERAEAKCRQLVRQILRQNPSSYIAIIGCYAQTGFEALQRIEGIDLIVGTQDKLRLAEFIEEPLKEVAPRIVRSPMSRDHFTIATADDLALSTTRANLKIQEGCDFMCSFCIIPFARGRARSRVFEDIEREALHLVERGYREIVLTGVNIGTYRFADKTFLDVVKRLLTLPGLERLRISSIEPTTIPEELLEMMKESPHLCHHLHIPLQTASDKLLQGMKRRYTLAEFHAFVERAVDQVPDLLLATDLIVGFPGEDDQAFAESCRYLETSRLAYAHIFSYSERRGTAAQRLPGKIDTRLKKERSQELHAISERKKEQFYRGFLGRSLRVLTEEQDERGRWTGFTDNYLKVVLPETSGQANQFLEVVLTDVVEGMAWGK